MRLDKVPSGMECFVDANIFIYHFTGVSEECSRFLKRCEEGSIEGVTATNVVLEVLHRLMMVEAVKKGLVTPPNVLRKLQRSPETVRELVDYSSNVEKIPQMGIKVLPFSWETIKDSQAIRSRYGLMVNDSLIVAIMKEKGIAALASNDEAFEKVEEISLHGEFGRWEFVVCKDPRYIRTIIPRLSFRRRLWRERSYAAPKRETHI